ncbi:hypothetical protein PENSPDRAFT_133234 [Peniophora sp. CONT]|nr:hypothetical protein PENSPDRAFT_133234 [Peniophora sp. CONT]
MYNCCTLSVSNLALLSHNTTPPCMARSHRRPKQATEPRTGSVLGDPSSRHRLPVQAGMHHSLKGHVEDCMMNNANMRCLSTPSCSITYQPFTPSSPDRCSIRRESHSRRR